MYSAIGYECNSVLLLELLRTSFLHQRCATTLTQNLCTSQTKAILNTNNKFSTTNKQAVVTNPNLTNGQCAQMP